MSKCALGAKKLRKLERLTGRKVRGALVPWRLATRLGRGMV